MKQLKRYAQLAWFDLPYMALITVGIFAIGMVMALLICAFFVTRSDGFGMVGTSMGFVGILVAVLIRHNLNPHTRLFIALIMGESRRSYLFFDTVTAAAECLLLCALLWVLGHVEIAVYHILLPGWQNEMNVLSYFRPDTIAVFIAALVTLNLFWTALMGRFGIKGFFLTWFPLWLLMVLMAPAIDAAQSGERSLLGLIGKGMLWVIDACSFIPWQAIVAAAVAVILALSAALLRRIAVRL